MSSIPEWRTILSQAEKHFDEKRLDEAVRLAERVVQLNPNSPGAYQVLGLTCVERFQMAEAMLWLKRALALQPDLVPSHNGMGQCYSHLGDLRQALHSFDIALMIEPGHSFAHFNRALICLKQGQYREGWLEFEWRFASGLVQRPAIPRPRWDGSPLEGRSTLIHSEQGLGDVLQWLRFLPLLRHRGARVVFACQKALHRLLRNLTCVDEWFPIDTPGTVNFHVYSPLLSLTASSASKRRRSTQVPYVFPEPERVGEVAPRRRAEA